MVRIERVRVTYRVRQLLSRQWRFPEITLTRPSIVLIHDAAGWHIANLLRPRRNDSPNAQPVELPSLVVERGHRRHRRRDRHAGRTAVARPRRMRSTATSASTPVARPHRPGDPARHVRGRAAGAARRGAVGPLDRAGGPPRRPRPAPAHGAPARSTPASPIARRPRRTRRTEPARHHRRARGAGAARPGGVRRARAGARRPPPRAVGHGRRQRAARRAGRESRPSRIRRRAAWTRTSRWRCGDRAKRITGRVTTTRLDLAPILKDRALASRLTTSDRIDLTFDGPWSFDTLSGTVGLQSTSSTIWGYRWDSVRGAVKIARKTLTIDGSVAGYGARATATRHHRADGQAGALRACGAHGRRGRAPGAGAAEPPEAGEPDRGRLQGGGRRLTARRVGHLRGVHHRRHRRRRRQHRTLLEPRRRASLRLHRPRRPRRRPALGPRARPGGD